MQPTGSLSDPKGLERAWGVGLGIKQLGVRPQVRSAATCTVDRNLAQRCLRAEAAQSAPQSVHVSHRSCIARLERRRCAAWPEPGGDPCQVAMHWRQVWWPVSKWISQPRLGFLLSGDHCTPLHTPPQPSCQTEPPQSALSLQKQASPGTMPTLHICSHGNTVALQCQHTDNPEHSLHALLPAIMQPVMPIRVQPESATSHDLP